MKHLVVILGALVVASYVFAQVRGIAEIEPMPVTKTAPTRITRVQADSVWVLMAVEAERVASIFPENLMSRRYHLPSRTFTSRQTTITEYFDKSGLIRKVRYKRGEWVREVRFGRALAVNGRIVARSRVTKMWREQ